MPAKEGARATGSPLKAQAVSLRPEKGAPQKKGADRQKAAQKRVPVKAVAEQRGGMTVAEATRILSREKARLGLVPSGTTTPSSAQGAPMQAAHTQSISQAAARSAPGQVYRQPSQAFHQGTLQGPPSPPPPPRTPTNRGILHHVSFQESSDSQAGGSCPPDQDPGFQASMSYHESPPSQHQQQCHAASMPPSSHSPHSSAYARAVDGTQHAQQSWHPHSPYAPPAGPLQQQGYASGQQSPERRNDGLPTSSGRHASPYDPANQAQMGGVFGGTSASPGKGIGMPSGNADFRAGPSQDQKAAAARQRQQLVADLQQQVAEKKARDEARKKQERLADEAEERRAQQGAAQLAQQQAAAASLQARPDVFGDWPSLSPEASGEILVGASGSLAIPPAHYLRAGKLDLDLDRAQEAPPQRHQASRMDPSPPRHLGPRHDDPDRSRGMASEPGRQLPPQAPRHHMAPGQRELHEEQENERQHHAPAPRAGPDPEAEASRQLLLEVRREQSSLRSLVEQQAAAMQQLTTSPPRWQEPRQPAVSSTPRGFQVETVLVPAPPSLQDAYSNQPVPKQASPPRRTSSGKACETRSTRQTRQSQETRQVSRGAPAPLPSRGLGSQAKPRTLAFGSSQAHSDAPKGPSRRR